MNDSRVPDRGYRLPEEHRPAPASIRTDDPTPTANTGSHAELRGRRGSRSEISAARLRTQIPGPPPIGLPAPQTSAVLGGRAIRRTTSPRPSLRGSAHRRGDGTADLTFNPGWLNFPTLQVEGIALESRLPCGPPGRPWPKGLALPIKSFWRTGAASGRTPRSPRGGAAGISDTNSGGWPLIPLPTQRNGAKPRLAPELLPRLK